MLLSLWKILKDFYSFRYEMKVTMCGGTSTCFYYTWKAGQSYYTHWRHVTYIPKASAVVSKTSCFLPVERFTLRSLVRVPALLHLVLWGKSCSGSQL